MYCTFKLKCSHSTEVLTKPTFPQYIATKRKLDISKCRIWAFHTNGKEHIQKTEIVSTWKWLHIGGWALVDINLAVVFRRQTSWIKVCFMERSLETAENFSTHRIGCGYVFGGTYMQWLVGFVETFIMHDVSEFKLHLLLLSANCWCSGCVSYYKVTVCVI